MNQDKQNEPLRLAGVLRENKRIFITPVANEFEAAAKELCTQHALIAELDAQTAHMADLVDQANYAHQKMKEAQARVQELEAALVKEAARIANYKLRAGVEQRRALREAVLKEREACAQVLDAMAAEAEADLDPSSVVAYYRDRSAAIRARGKPEQPALAAAPQPPEAAPVQMPEPVYTMRVRGRLHDYTPTLQAFDLDDGEHNLYTEQQVRQLLADHGIK